MKLQLSLGITSNPRTWPIIDGRVVPDAIDPVINVCDPSELFWRQLRFAEFDVSEMSMSSLMMIRSQGDERFVGLPVFTTRRFFHTNILVRRDARRASAWACQSINRPRRCGSEGLFKANSVLRQRIWNFGWNVGPRAVMPARSASKPRRA
jgi:4,5-dihydroxyphthalate decarboxylase